MEATPDEVMTTIISSLFTVCHIQNILRLKGLCIKKKIKREPDKYDNLVAFCPEENEAKLKQSNFLPTFTY